MIQYLFEYWQTNACVRKNTREARERDWGWGKKTLKRRPDYMYR